MTYVEVLNLIDESIEKGEKISVPEAQYTVKALKMVRKLIIKEINNPTETPPVTIDEMLERIERSLVK